MKKKYRRLTYDDRQIIEKMAERKLTANDIAAITDVSVSTIYRELERGINEEGRYKADIAQKTILLRRKSKYVKV